MMVTMTMIVYTMPFEKAAACADFVSKIEGSTLTSVYPWFCCSLDSQVAINFAVKLGSEAGVATIKEGRAYVFLSIKNDTEPRFTIGDDQDTQQIFGQNVHDFSAGSHRHAQGSSS